MASRDPRAQLSSVGPTRLDPNLRVLVGRGLLADGETDDRVTTSELTGAGHALLVRRAERLAVLCDLRDPGAPARGDGN